MVATRSLTWSNFPLTCLGFCLGPSSAVKPKLMLSPHSISLLPPGATDTGRHLQQRFNSGMGGGTVWVCVWVGGGWSVQVGNLSSAVHPHSEPGPLSQCVGFCVESHCEGPGPVAVVSGASLLRQRARLGASTLPKQKTDWLTGCLAVWLTAWLGGSSAD